MKLGLEYFLDDVRKITKTRPPYNEAFVSRMLNLMNTAITIIEGLNAVILKYKADKKNPEVVERPFEKPQKSKYRGSGIANLMAYRERVAKRDRNQEIISQFMQGLSKAEIAKIHVISQSRVYNILKREGVL